MRAGRRGCANVEEKTGKAAIRDCGLVHPGDENTVPAWFKNVIDKVFVCKRRRGTDGDSSNVNVIIIKNHVKLDGADVLSEVRVQVYEDRHVGGARTGGYGVDRNSGR